MPMHALVRLNLHVSFVDFSSSQSRYCSCQLNDGRRWYPLFFSEPPQRQSQAPGSASQLQTMRTEINIVLERTLAALEIRKADLHYYLIRLMVLVFLVLSG